MATVQRSSSWRWAGPQHVDYHLSIAKRIAEKTKKRTRLLIERAKEQLSVMYTIERLEDRLKRQEAAPGALSTKSEVCERYHSQQQALFAESLHEVAAGNVSCTNESLVCKHVLPVLLEHCHASYREIRADIARKYRWFHRHAPRRYRSERLERLEELAEEWRVKAVFLKNMRADEQHPSRGSFARTIFASYLFESAAELAEHRRQKRHDLADVCAVCSQQLRREHVRLPCDLGQQRQHHAHMACACKWLLVSSGCPECHGFTASGDFWAE